MNKTITIVVGEKELKKQAKLLDQIIDKDTLRLLICKSSDKKKAEEELLLLEGLWEMCHCILDKCEEAK